MKSYLIALDHLLTTFQFNYCSLFLAKSQLFTVSAKAREISNIELFLKSGKNQECSAKPRVCWDLGKCYGRPLDPSYEFKESYIIIVY